MYSSIAFSDLIAKLSQAATAGRWSAASRSPGDVWNLPNGIRTERCFPSFNMLAMGAYGSGDLLLASSQLSDLMKTLGSAQLRAAAELLPTNPWATAPGQLARVQLALGKPD
jgi:hypothetical protein